MYNILRKHQIDDRAARLGKVVRAAAGNASAGGPASHFGAAIVNAASLPAVALPYSMTPVSAAWCGAVAPPEGHWAGAAIAGGSSPAICQRHCPGVGQSAGPLSHFGHKCAKAHWSLLHFPFA